MNHASVLDAGRNETSGMCAILSFWKMELALDFLLPEFEEAVPRWAKEVEKSGAADALVSACSLSSKLVTLLESYSLLAPLQADGMSFSSSMVSLVAAAPQFL